MRPILLIFLTLFVFESAIAQDHSHSHGRHLDFPDVQRYKTVLCDFHQHTVFSDGSVWPNIRVQEAEKDGIDAISLTEHLEYQPHKDDIPHPDRNRSYEIAKNHAENKDLIIISGSEITRSMPPGHANAIFIKDANKLLDKDPMVVFREAKAQGAFVFWNHPNWTSQVKSGIASLTPLHNQLLAENLMQGIEVVNEDTYSDEALQIALDNNLTIMGTSDIHGLIDWQYNVPHGHRPVTLVFAEERTEEGIKEGLFSRRTVVFFNNVLIGRLAHLKPLIEASLKAKDVSYLGSTQVLSVTLVNNSSVEYILDNKSGYTLHKHTDLVTVPAKSKIELQVKTLENLDHVTLKFEVLNAVNAPNSHPELIMELVVE
jgi:hypothetical protein